MDKTQWFKEKQEREAAALKRHARLAELFREDRFSFENETRKMIHDVIRSASTKDLRGRLEKIQADWDRKMKGAGSGHNRFVLARTFFWEHFHDVWHPTIQRCNQRLNGPEDTPPSF